MGVQKGYPGEWRSFHFTSVEFWRIKLQGSSYVVWFGRAGTSGQIRIKQFGSSAQAHAAYTKIIFDKLGKGYAEDEEFEGLVMMSNAADFACSDIEPTSTSIAAEAASTIDALLAGKSVKKVKPTKFVKPTALSVQRAKRKRAKKDNPLKKPKRKVVFDD